MMFMLGFVLLGTTLLLPLFAQTMLGYTAREAGLSLMPGGLVIIICMPVVGFLLSKYDPRWMMMYGLSVLTAAMIYMSHFNLYMDFKHVAAARVIQGMGDRAGRPFVTVNCGAIPAGEIEATLFGHKKGAFPGATADQPGKFAEAHGGTLFLDEVGELSLDTQLKLLNVIKNGQIEPVGCIGVERVNVRVISATNRRLLNLARSGAFREDLYYRLNVFPIYVPPLRDRTEDIAPLVAHFIARLSAEAGRRVTGISADALLLLKSYDWPGNIRQLENVLYRAIVLADSAVLEAVDFPQVVAWTTGRDAAVKAALNLNAPSAPVHIDFTTGRVKHVEGPGTNPDRFLTERGEVTALADLERELIVFAIKHHAGRMSRVARALKIGRSTLYRKLREYGLEGAVESDAA